MRTLLIPLTLGLAVGCTQNTDDILTEDDIIQQDDYADADLEPDQVTDVHGQLGIPAVDVLWVVDNSLSMYEEQRALTNNFTSFMRFFTESEYDLDYHIGVVTTGFDDDEERGRLRTAVDSRGDTIRWIDPEVRNAFEAFREMALIGTDGPYEEKGRAQVFHALETLGGTENAGFLRNDAYLSIIVLSDEDDRSGDTPVDVPEFVDWLSAFKGSPEQVTFSSIVGPEGGCGNVEEGTEYLEVTRAVGGVVHPICEPSWATVMEDLGLSAAGLRDEFALSRLPADPDAIEVEVKAPREEAVPYTIGLQLEYVKSRNAVRFLDVIPPPESRITIRYEAADF